MQKILIVEDNAVIASINQNKLVAEGFHVEVASDGEAGLKVLGRLRPDLVLLDLMMPKMNGIEVIKHIRSQPAFVSLPIIVFSNSYNSATANEAMLAGANQVLTKATNTPRQVVDAVRITLAAAAAAPAQAPQAEAGRRSDAEFQAGLRRTLLRDAPDAVTALRAALQEAVKSAGEAAHLFDLYQKVHSLSGNAGLSGLHEISRIASALEALLEELHERPKQATAATLRTVARAVEVLAALLEAGAPVDAERVSSTDILVVDDEQIARRAITYALGKVGLRAICVRDSTTALNLLEENHFDLVLLDVEMPGVNGLELCAKMRATSLHEKTPVIFVTTGSGSERRAEAALSGDDFIAKPFMYTELALKTLISMMARRRA